MLQCFSKIQCMLCALAVTTLTIFVSGSATAETMANKYFSIDLPAGWSCPAAPREVGGGLGAGFVSDKGTVALSISPTTKSAKEMVEESIVKMKASGLEPSAPVEKNGFYEITLSHPTLKTATVWMGVNDKIFSMTLAGGDIEACKVLIKALKPVNTKLFPQV